MIFKVERYDILGRYLGTYSTNSKSRAWARYEQTVTSAPCGNVGRIELSATDSIPSREVLAAWERPLEKPVNTKEKSMKFIIRAVTRTGTKIHKKCPEHPTPREHFAQCVVRAIRRGDKSVQLIKISSSGFEDVLDSWEKSVDGKADGEVEIYKYKIHALPTAQKGAANKSNDTFYATKNAAVKQATQYVTRSRNPESMVIYKAIKIIRAAARPAARPVVIEDVE